jgi:hypothetical protein
MKRGAYLMHTQNAIAIQNSARRWTSSKAQGSEVSYCVRSAYSRKLWFVQQAIGRRVVKFIAGLKNTRGVCGSAFTVYLKGVTKDHVD